MYLPSMCRLVHMAASLVLKCSHGATPRMLRPFDDSGYQTLEWLADRCFKDELLTVLPRSVFKVVVGDNSCCFPPAMVDLLKVDAPRCPQDGHPDEALPPPQPVGGHADRSPYHPEYTSTSSAPSASHHHTHTLVGELLDHLLNVTVVLGVVLLLLLHRKLLGVIKAWKAALRRPTSPPEQSRAEGASAARPVAPASSSSTPDVFWPASPARPRTPPVQLAGRRRAEDEHDQVAMHPLIDLSSPLVLVHQRHHNHEDEEEEQRSSGHGTHEEEEEDKESEEEEKQAPPQPKKPWEKRPAKKLRRKAGKVIDLTEFTDEIIWYAARLVKSTMNAMLEVADIPLVSPTMTLLEKCRYLTVIKRDFPQIDLMAVLTRQNEEKKKEEQRKKQQKQQQRRSTRSQPQQSSSSSTDEESGDDDVFA